MNRDEIEAAAKQHGVRITGWGNAAVDDCARFGPRHYAYLAAAVQARSGWSVGHD
jgi:hypothetical protein